MTTFTAPITTTTSASPASRLRAVLTANAATSLVAGLVGLLATDRVVDELGLGSAGWTRVVSAGLVLFALDVALGARSARHLRTTALLATVGDGAWLVGTAAVLATVELTGVGVAVAVVLGVGVVDFAVLQLWFLRRLER